MINTPCIYIITNLITCKVYIGQTTNPKIRKRKHFGGHSNCRYLTASIQKYGKENFVFEILEYCDLDKLTEREQYWMDVYRSQDREYGYNIKDADSHAPFSEEIRQKISNKLKGNTCALGYKRNSEEIENMRQRMVGNCYWAGKEHKEDSISILRKKATERTHSDKTKQRIKETRLSNPSSNRKRKLIVVHYYTGVLLLFDSIRKAASFFEVSKTFLCTCITKGYYKEYVLFQTSE